MTMLSETQEFTAPIWDKAAQQFSQLIGYWDNREGERVRRRFYFDDHKGSAIKKSIQKQKEWQRVVEKQRAEDEVNRRLAPNYPRTPPKWPKDDNSEEANDKQGGATLKGKKKPVGQYTVMQAVEAYLDAKKSEVGLAGGAGIKATTVNGLNSSLRLAMGLGIGKDTKDKPIRDEGPIDPKMLLTALTKSDLEHFRNFWMRLPTGMNTGKPLSVRTAINYCLTFKGFVDWCNENEEFGFDRPKATDSIFNFKGMKKSKIEKYDPKKLKSIMENAVEKTKLYLLLALNCGHYQADIGNIRASEIRVIEGEPYLYRQRTKMTDVAAEEIGADEGDEQYVLTYLWPETYALLEKHRAPANPFNRLLLNERGTPLWHEEVGKLRRDAITPAIERAVDAAETKLKFRQIRKYTWNAMKRISGGSNDFAKKWAGQAVEGISANYEYQGDADLASRYADVTAALKKWRKELIANEVLVPVIDGTAK